MARPHLALYLHIPFCDHRCAYCDFNAYAGLDELIPAYVEALLAELALWAPAASSYDVATVFFGGGTPSLLSPPQMAALVRGIERGYRVAPGAEVTMEANPGTIDAAKLRGFRAAGVNRLSIGVQSLDDTELARLDRIHSAEVARQAFADARAAGFDNINLDLIFGLPYGTAGSWRRTLESALALGPEHLSLYALSVEEGTPLAERVERGIERSPDPDAAAAQYEWACERLAAAGYRQYEISNWARPGRECRHNLVYWRNEPYIGLGAGAHSCWAGERFAVVRSPRRYIELMAEAAAAPPSPPAAAAMPQIAERETQTRVVAMGETMMMGLRLDEGVSHARFAGRFGIEPRAAFATAIDECVADGLVGDDGVALRLTERGRLLGNEAFVRFLTPPEPSQAYGGPE